MDGKKHSVLVQWLRDMGLGALIFLVLSASAVMVSSQDRQWLLSGAQAGEVIATRAVEVTAPAGPQAENAIVAAAQLRPAHDPLLFRRMMAFGVLCLSFSLLVAFNLAFWRHLQSVAASQRRDG